MDTVHRQEEGTEVSEVILKRSNVDLKACNRRELSTRRLGSDKNRRVYPKVSRLS